VADPALRVAGWHLFTFNEIRRTEAWRQRLLAR
jgi:methylenetetrahydrofolate reductase (NADPH)